MIKNINEQILGLRSQIDRIDCEILELIKRRFDLCSWIGKIKSENGIAVYDNKREEEILLNRKILAGEKGISKDFIEQLFRLLFRESKKIQGMKD